MSARVEWDFDAEEDYDGYVDEDESMRRMMEEYGRRSKGRNYPDYATHGRGERGLNYGGAPRGGTPFPPPPPGKEALEARVLAVEDDDEGEEEEDEVLDFKDLKRFLLGESPSEGDGEAPDGFRAEAKPAEGNLLLRPFKPRVRSLFTMQVIASAALLFIYVVNYILNPEFFDTLTEITAPIPVVGNWAVLTTVGALAGLSLIVYSYMKPRAKKWTGIIILAGLFVISLLLPVGSLISGGWMGAVLQLWAEFQFAVKLVLIFLVVSPLILGVLGIWLESRLSLYVSACLLLSIVIILDVFLIIFSQAPEKQIWSFWLVVFACGLFIFFEFGDSAIRFHKLYSESVEKDQRSVQARHIVRMCKRYLVFSAAFLVVSMFLVLLIYNSNTILLGLADLLEGVPAIGGFFQDATYLEKTSASVVMDTVYGALISMGMVIFVMVLVGSVVRNWYDISSWGRERYTSVTEAMASRRELEASEDDDLDQVVVRRQEAKRRRRKGDAPAGRGRSRRPRIGGGGKARKRPSKYKGMYAVKEVKLKSGRVGAKAKGAGRKKAGKNKKKR